MAKASYLIRIKGFYRASKIDSIPTTSGVLMVFEGQYVGGRSCHIEKFCKASAAINIKDTMQKDLGAAVEPAKEGGTILYFAYVEADSTDAEQISNFINRRFKDNESALMSSNQVNVSDGIAHIQLEGAVPIIWSDSRDFYLITSTSQKGE